MKKILIIIILILSTIYAWIDYNLYYPEKFRIKDAHIEIFEIKERSEIGCIRLNYVPKVQKAQEYILAVKFDIEYVSLVREHFLINKPKEPWGAFGALDSIERIIVYSKNTNDTVFLNDKLIDASKYRKFVFKVPINEHSIINSGSGTCYEAQIYETFDDFIKVYNENKLDYRMYNLINDYHFFLISKEVSENLINSDLKISLKQKLYGLKNKDV